MVEKLEIKLQRTNEKVSKEEKKLLEDFNKILKKSEKKMTGYDRKYKVIKNTIKSITPKEKEKINKIMSNLQYYLSLYTKNKDLFYKWYKNYKSYNDVWEYGMYGITYFKYYVAEFKELNKQLKNK